MNIKVCGITQVKQLKQLEAINIDYAGLIFYPESPRYVINKMDKNELKNADFDIKKVGVFVNADFDEIYRQVNDYSLDVVQLHGSETPALCARLVSKDIEVIKAFHINNNTSDIDALLADYDEVCDFYLFDTATGDGKLGGTGEKFDWNKISQAKIEKPFFLSGGIGLNDRDKIESFDHADFYGIDVNSKFEKEPGIKDMSMILQLKQYFRAKV